MRIPPQLAGLWFLSEPEVCNVPRTGRSGGQNAQALEERSRSSLARLGELADPARAGKPEEARGPAQSQGLPCPRPPRRGLRSLPSSPRRAGRGASTKDSNFRAARAHPANSWPRRGPREGGGQRAPGRPKAGAGGPGPPTQVGGPGGGRGGGGLELLGLPGLLERPKKEFLKIGSGSSEEVDDGTGTRNNPPHPEEDARGPPLTRAERSGGRRAARKEAVPPHSGAEGREEGGGPSRRARRRSTRTRAAPSASPGSAPCARAARAPRRTDSGASTAAVSPSLGPHHSGARGRGRPERLPSLGPACHSDPSPGLSFPLASVSREGR